MTMTNSEKRAYDAALEKCINELASDPRYFRDYDQDDIYDEGRKIRNRHIDELIRQSLKDAGVSQFYEPFGANSRVKNELSRRWYKKIYAVKEERRRRAIEEEEEEFHALVQREKAEKEERHSSPQSRIHDDWMWVAAGGGSWFPGSIPDEFKMTDRPVPLEDEPWFP